MILNGSKKFELRRRFTSKDVKNILIYETSPTMKVVGEIKIKKIHILPLEELWSLTAKSNGVSKEEFFKYYKGLSEGIAIEVIEPKKFGKPEKLDKYDISKPPQSFQFIKSKKKDNEI